MTAPGDPEARLREDALSVVRAGLRAVDPCALIEDTLLASPRNQSREADFWW